MNKFLGFAEGEITVYCGVNARANLITSLRQAMLIAKSDRAANIMYVNTVFSTRKLLTTARQELPSPVTSGEGLGEREGIFFQYVQIGELARYLDTIRETIEANEIKYLIVNSWEFANRSYGYKEKALYGLMNLANDLGVSVIVYSQANMENAESGKMHRAGLGKLAAVCDAIIWVNSEEEEIKPQPEVKILSSNKINNLEYARSESGVSSGGELILPEMEEVLEEEMEMV